MTLTHTHWRRRNQIAGQIIALLRRKQPSPVVVSAIRDALGLDKRAIFRALERCQDIGAVHVDWGSRLVTLLDSAVVLPAPPEEAAPPPMPADERLICEAILQRVTLLVQRGKLPAAISLLQRAASRSRGPVAVNFLALADLYGAGHRRYPTIARADAWRLQAAAGICE